MTGALIFVAATLALDIGIIAILYGIARNAEPQKQSRPYRAMRPWNFR